MVDRDALCPINVMSYKLAGGKRSKKETMRLPEQVTWSNYKMAIQQLTSNKPGYNIPPNGTINQHTTYLYSTHSLAVL